jgi:quercetin dioxygenase-like cupin family protein
MKSGWFIGNFEPTAFRTNLMEVCYKMHPKGEQWDIHYHRYVTEITLLISGSMKLQGKLLSSGDIFILEPYEIADPEFIEDCSIVCIKCPGITGDKIIIK